MSRHPSSPPSRLRRLGRTAGATALAALVAAGALLAGAVPATLIAAIILRDPAVLAPAVGLSLLAWLSGTALGARTARNRGRR